MRSGESLWSQSMREAESDSTVGMRLWNS